jgi:Protein of unknown function (DUF3830)
LCATWQVCHALSSLSRVRIHFERGGIFTARLFDDVAPKTCNLIRTHLPLTCRFHHTMVSGEAIVTFLDDLTGDPENQRVLGITPGALCFVVHRDVPRIVDEIYITYGIFSSRRLLLDMKQPVNLFGQIDDQLGLLRDVGARILMNGAESVQFTSP